VDLDDKCGGDGGEQTGLYYGSTHVNCQPARETHKYESGAQVFIIFLAEFFVVLFCFTAVHVIELSSKNLRGWRQLFLLAARGFKDGSE